MCCSVDTWSIWFSLQWVPVTKLGRLVKELKIKTLEHIYLFSLPIKVRSLDEDLSLKKISRLGLL